MATVSNRGQFHKDCCYPVVEGNRGHWTPILFMLRFVKNMQNPQIAVLINITMCKEKERLPGWQEKT